MSDTPDTDAAAAKCHGMPIGSKCNHYVDVDFARKLERERDESRINAFVAAKMLEKLKDKIAIRNDGP